MRLTVSRTGTPEERRVTLFVIEGCQRLIAGKGEGDGDKVCDDSFRVLAGLCLVVIQL